MGRLRLAVWGIAVGMAVTALACGGGGNGSPTQPTPPPPPAGGGGGGGGGGSASSVTITVTAGGVSASAATLAAGGTITWVNNDTRAHDMSSDPHPQHTDCPGLGAGDLNPGQQRSTGPITVSRTCGFHDHLNPGTQALQGSIRIQ